MRARVLALLCVTFATPGPLGADVIERLLATVSGQFIMASDVAAARRLGLVPDDGTGQQVLDRLIDRALILAEVERYAPPEPPEAAVDRELERVRARFADAAAFERELAVLGLDAHNVRDRIRENFRIEAYLDQRFVVVPPTDAEIDAAFRADFSPRRDSSTVREEIRRRLIDERRQARVDEWIEALRRRSRIIRLAVDAVNE